MQNSTFRQGPRVLWGVMLLSLLACAGCPPKRWLQYSPCTAYFNECWILEGELRREQPDLRLSPIDRQRVILAYQAPLYLDGEIVFRAWNMKKPPPKNARIIAGVGRYHADIPPVIGAVTRLHMENGDWEGLLRFLRGASELLQGPKPERGTVVVALANSLEAARRQGADSREVAQMAGYLITLMDKEENPYCRVQYDRARTTLRSLLDQPSQSQP